MFQNHYIHLKHDFRREDWLEFCSKIRPDLLELGVDKLHQKRVCERHFSAVDFTMLGSQKKLKRMATPSILPKKEECNTKCMLKIKFVIVIEQLYLR